MTFGEYIKQKREAMGWTQPEAAARAGIEQSYLSKLETGKSVPSEEIFSKLTALYEIDADDMTAQFSLDEVDKMKEIKAVRSAILEKEKKAVKVTRGWLLAALAFLMTGAACLGFALMPNPAERQFHYRSEGVLLPGEELTAFQILREDLRTYGQLSERDKAMLIKQREMLGRLDQKDIILLYSKGDNFVDETEDGKRFYEMYDRRVVEQETPFKWFMAPALMFLFGSFGCFIVSLRWK